MAEGCAARNPPASLPDNESTMPKHTHAHLPLLFGALLVAPACTTSSELFCESHDDCADVEGRPFCDLTGEFPGSEGHGKTCIASPFDAGVDDPDDAGDPDAPDAGGAACPLGHDDSGTRCLELDPSNGLAAALDDAADQAAVTLPDGTTIDTDTGTVTSGSGAIGVATTTVPQPGGRDLRVFMASSWTLHDVRIEGTLPVAFVASGDVEIAGLVDVSADGNTPGAGANDCGGTGAGGEPSGGYWSRVKAGAVGSTGTYVWNSGGGGGGGFGTAGATGGEHENGDALSAGGAGGSVNGAAALVPLRGGCSGGGHGPDYAGAGGGAVQIVSGRVITVQSNGRVHAGGGGGRGTDLGAELNSVQYESAGGGSGGGILLEAPEVSFGSSTLLLAAGGGGGGAGGCAQRHGEDAPANAGTAAGGTCPAEGWGQPAGGGAGASAAAAQSGSDTDYHSAGGGGGGAGRVRINTADASFTGEGNATVRGALTTGTVAVR